jgi:tripartite-type tricarboxylate transporter receptor subunit TctC
VLRFMITLVVGLVASVNSVTVASAQTYPQRAVKFILPFGPAAGSDITARLLAEKLAARWGKPVVVENRPGGDGLVAINAFTSANDEHTLLFVPASTFTAHPYVHEKLPYDAERDLLPITNVTTIVIALSAPASLNVKTLAEFRPDLVCFHQDPALTGDPGAVPRHPASTERPGRSTHPPSNVILRDHASAGSGGKG